MCVCEVGGKNKGFYYATICVWAQGMYVCRCVCCVIVFVILWLLCVSGCSYFEGGGIVVVVIVVVFVLLVKLIGF